MADDTEMVDDTEPEPEPFRPANDNSGLQGEPDAEKPGTEKPSTETWRKIGHAALTLARIIGRRMAREDYAARVAANDNRPDQPDKTTPP